jgi:large subunit ribosomal protein L24
MNSLSVKKGDNVLVIAGKDKGKTGSILSVLPIEKRVLVKGVNIITKHKKARSASDQGGIEKLEGKIDVSNVQVICPSCDKATRIAHKIVDGKKIRVCKKCDASLDINAKKSPKKATAKKATAKKTTTKKAPAKKTTAKETTAKKAPVSKAPVKKVPAKKVAVKKVAAKKTVAKKSTGNK